MEEKVDRSYKILPGDEVMIWCKYVTNKDGVVISNYTVQMRHKQFNGEVMKFYKRVKFKKGINIPNQTKVKLIRFLENIYPNPNDKWGYISELFILEFEIVKKELDNNELVEEYAKNLGSGEMAGDYNAYANSINNVEEVTPDDLPF